MREGRLTAEYSHAGGHGGEDHAAATGQLERAT